MLKRFVHSLGLVELPPPPPLPPTYHQRDQRNSKSHVAAKNKEGRRRSSRSQGRGTKVSPDVSLRSNDFVVRVAHKGGQQEVYHHTFPASNLMAKYPGMRVASWGVFKDPHKSVLEPGEMLLVGHKYIMMSPRDVEKLKRKHPPQGGEDRGPDGVAATLETLELESDIMATKSPGGHKHKQNGEIIGLLQNGVHGQEMVETRMKLSPNGCKVREANWIGDQERVDVVPDGGGAVEEPYFCAKDFYSVPREEPTRHTRRRRIRHKHFVPPLPKTRLYRGFGWQPRLPTVQEVSP